MKAEVGAVRGQDGCCKGHRVGNELGQSVTYVYETKNFVCSIQNEQRGKKEGEREKEGINKLVYVISS